MADDPHPLIAEAIRLVGGRQIHLAERLGRPQQYVSKLLNREVPVSAETAAAIDRATDGQVAKSALRPDLWPPERAPQPAESHA